MYQSRKPLSQFAYNNGSPYEVHTPSNKRRNEYLSKRNADSCYKRRDLALPLYEINNSGGSNLKFIDSHCHIDFLFRNERFDASFKDYRKKYFLDFPPSYKGCVSVFCEPSSFGKPWQWRHLLEEDGVWAAFGCHPKKAENFNNEAERSLRVALRHPRVVALGEIGLDYSNGSHAKIDTQKRVFRKQLRMAVEADLPLVIHSRDAQEDCLEILKEEVPRDHHIHRHCFTGDWKEAETWTNTFPNLCIGITGLVTFPSAKELHETARKIPLNKLLLETDAPYFLPKHKMFKGRKWSNPGMALHVAAQIEALRPDVTLDKLLEETYNNTIKLYRLNRSE